ncbi:MAG: hypothetical protein ABR562_00010 [Thermoplasmatota archaeon]|nr:hypothetical protein [Halobacteriales archaeon]
MATAVRWHSYWLTTPTQSPAPSFRHDCRATLPGILPWSAVFVLPVLLVAGAQSHVLGGGAGALAFWLGILTELLLALVLLGWCWRRTHRGIAIGGGNVVSLGVIQTILWTSLFVAAALAVLLLSGASKVPSLDGDAVLQVGVGVGALGGGAALSVRKKGLTVQPEVRRHAAELMVRDEERLIRQQAQGVLRKAGQTQVADLRTALGKADAKALCACLPDSEDVRNAVAAAPGGALYSNLCPCQARFVDALQGDEWANARSLDVGKLQFVVFTLLGLYAYAAGLVAAFLHGDASAMGVDVGAYPRGLLEVVGLSSAGYLGLKAPVQTPLAPQAVLG